MTNTAETVEPRPIEAEFEPTGEPEAKASRRGLPPPKLSRTVGWGELLVASAGASVMGAVMAIVVTNANSGAETGTLALEIDTLNRSQEALASRADQASADFVTLRSRIDAQADRLARQDAEELALRAEISAVSGQVSALSGAGPGTGAAVPGAIASNSPLGVLLSRINRVENVIADDASAPQTTRQMQRSIADLSANVDSLTEANGQLTEALNKRQAALAALEAGLKSVSTDMDVVRGRVAKDDRIGVQLGILRTPTQFAAVGPQPVNAAEESRTIRALSSLETAAQRGGSFLPQQQVLASLLPQDDGVSSLAGIARDGAPAFDALKHDFNVAARNAQRISAEKTDDGWNWLRPAYSTSSARGPVNSTTDIVAEARRSLEVGDARGAVEAINEMSGPASRAFRTWRAEALKRAEVDERLDALNRRLVGASNFAGSGRDS
jgi:hypothetical protein